MKQYFRVCDVVLLSMVLCCGLLIDVTASQTLASPTESTAPTNHVTDSSANEETSTARGEVSGDLDQGISGPPGVPDSEPHVVIPDPRGQACLLATLNATMQVSYQVQEGIVHQTYLAVADIQLPEDVTATGLCGDNSSSLLLTWGHNDTFRVNMTFSWKEARSRKENATWSLASLEVTYDLSDKEVFPGASENNVVTAARSDLALFPTTDGYSYQCDRDISTHVGTVDRGVDVTFHSVHLAAFGVSSEEFPQATVVCSAGDSSDSDDDILVPLITACCLSALVVIIVIGYVISRKVQEAREQSEYRPMP